MTEFDYVQQLSKANQVSSEEMLTGERIKFIQLPSYSCPTYIVTENGKFFIADEEIDYYNSHRYTSRSLEFNDICHTNRDGIIELTDFGKAINADIDICTEILQEQINKTKEFEREKRRLEYEKLKEEFETKNEK